MLISFYDLHLLNYFFKKVLEKLYPTIIVWKYGRTKHMLFSMYILLKIIRNYHRYIEVILI